MIQRKGMVAIECRGSPSVYGVTGGAVGTELTSMFSRLGVAGFASGRRAFEYTILVAIFAAHLGVRSSQREFGAGMVEGGTLPTVWDMAACTVSAELAVVFVILFVAGITILRRGLQICEGARIEVALCTRHAGVSAVKFEDKNGVGKIASKPVHTVVAGKTIHPKGQDMSLGEDNIHLTVTTVAGGWIKRRDILTVAIGTGEGFARRRQLVPFQ